MTTPYRIIDKPQRTEQPAAELVYVAGDQERRVAPARRTIQYALMGALGSVLAGAAHLPELSLGIVCVATVAAIVNLQRSRIASGLVLRVEDGELEVAPRGSKEARLRLRLAELADVRLDTKSIRKVELGKNVSLGPQLTDTSVGPEIDVARIVLRVQGRSEPIHLTEAFFPHMDSVEWAGKIRLFLRSHGWTPEDERRLRVADSGGEEEPLESEYDEEEQQSLRAR